MSRICAFILSRQHCCDYGEVKKQCSVCYQVFLLVLSASICQLICLQTCRPKVMCQLYVLCDSGVYECGCVCLGGLQDGNWMVESLFWDWCAPKHKTTAYKIREAGFLSLLLGNLRSCRPKSLWWCTDAELGGEEKEKENLGKLSIPSGLTELLFQAICVQHLKQSSHCVSVAQGNAVVSSLGYM